MKDGKTILKILISRGKFVGHCDARVDEFREDFVSGNGWKCRVFSDGSIRCKAYLNPKAPEEHISFKISRYGYVCLAKTTADGKKTELRRFKLRRWPIDGTIGLSDGNIDERYAYFHDEKYRKFLTNHKIYAIKKEDPNHLYTLYRLFLPEEEKSLQEIIQTDGKIEEVGKNSGRTQEWENKHPGTFSFEEYRVIRIYAATWAMITRKEDLERTKRILYTLMDIDEIEGLPENSQEE